MINRSLSISKSAGVFCSIMVVKLLGLFFIGSVLSGCQTDPMVKSTTNKLAKHERFRWSREQFLNPPLDKLAQQKLAYKAKNGQRITHALFGYYDEKKSGQVEFVVTDRIPYQVGLSYGWFFKVEGKTKGNSELIEEFQLPEPPRILRFNLESTKISNDGTRITTTLPFKEKNGWVNNSWMITPEDPKGPYSITIVEKDKNTPVHTFEFEIVK